MASKHFNLNQQGLEDLHSALRRDDNIEREIRLACRVPVDTKNKEKALLVVVHAQVKFCDKAMKQALLLSWVTKAACCKPREIP